MVEKDYSEAIAEELIEMSKEMVGKIDHFVCGYGIAEHLQEFEHSKVFSKDGQKTIKITMSIGYAEEEDAGCVSRLHSALTLITSTSAT